MLNVLKNVFSLILSGFKQFFIILGVLLFLSVLLSFSDYPYWAYFWLGTHNVELENDPNLIVVLGGGGMPSSDGLMRCYYATEAAKEFPNTEIYIALPEDTSKHEKSPELLMANELIIRGIDSNRIKFEKKGHNTYSQACNLYKLLMDEQADTLNIRLITSPEHMFRAVGTFRKLGFANVGGTSSFEEALPESLLINSKKSKKEIQTELKQLNVRYNMWNYLKYEIVVARELVAITYYKLHRWM